MRSATKVLTIKPLRIIKIWFRREIIKKQVIKVFTASFLGIGIIGFLGTALFDSNDAIFLIGSFGASAVLVFALPQSPLSSFKNLFGGHLLSGFIGVTCALLLRDYPWLAAALAVSLSIMLMQITNTLHPPGGATALIAIIGSAKIQSLGYFYLISPVLSGILILYLVARIIIK